jgi:hypothetical protein
LVKILKFFDADPGYGMEKIRIRDGKKSDPQHWKNPSSFPVFGEFNLFTGNRNGIFVSRLSLPVLVPAPLDIGPGLQQEVNVFRGTLRQVLF